MASIFSVTRVDTGPIVAGCTVRIRGENFLPPGSAGDLDVLTAVTVRFTSGIANCTRMAQTAMPTSSIA